MTDQSMAQLLGVSIPTLKRIKVDNTHKLHDIWCKIQSELDNNEKAIIKKYEFLTVFNNSPIKWVGGKKQIRHELISRIPTNIKTYYEPFVGGGTIYFNTNAKHYVINDINDQLINFYACLATDTDKVLSLVDFWGEQLAKQGKAFYYLIREMDRDKNFLLSEAYIQAARFLFLNKAAFNGIWRESIKGYHNVPWNQKSEVNFYNIENIKIAKDKLINSDIFNEDFEQVLKLPQKGDFVYLDPPYDVETDKSKFTTYHKDGFGRKDQVGLLNALIELDKKNVKWMMSNSNTKWIRENYAQFNIKIISTKIMINSNTKKRQRSDNEVIITNYPC